MILADFMPDTWHGRQPRVNNIFPWGEQVSSQLLSAKWDSITKLGFFLIYISLNFQRPHQYEDFESPYLRLILSRVLNQICVWYTLRLFVIDSSFAIIFFRYYLFVWNHALDLSVFVAAAASFDSNDLPSYSISVCKL